MLLRMHNIFFLCSLSRQPPNHISVPPPLLMTVSAKLLVNNARFDLIIMLYRCSRGVWLWSPN